MGIHKSQPGHYVQQRYDYHYSHCRRSNEGKRSYCLAVSSLYVTHTGQTGAELTGQWHLTRNEKSPIKKNHLYGLKLNVRTFDSKFLFIKLYHVIEI